MCFSFSWCSRQQQCLKHTLDLNPRGPVTPRLKMWQWQDPAMGAPSMDRPGGRKNLDMKVIQVTLCLILPTQSTGLSSYWSGRMHPLQPAQCAKSLISPLPTHHRSPQPIPTWGFTGCPISRASHPSSSSRLLSFPSKIKVSQYNPCSYHHKPP